MSEERAVYTAVTLSHVSYGGRLYSIGSDGRFGEIRDGVFIEFVPDVAQAEARDYEQVMS